MRSFAKDDEGEGAGGTGTSHVVVTAPVVVRDRVVGGDCVGLDDANDIWSVTWPPTTPKKNIAYPRSHKRRGPQRHVAAASLCIGGGEGGQRRRRWWPGKSPLLFLLEMNSGIGEAQGGEVGWRL